MTVTPEQIEEALQWMADIDPQLVEQAREKFGLTAAQIRVEAGARRFDKAAARAIETVTIERSKALNAELVAALEDVIAWDDDPHSCENSGIEKARAALAKLKEGK